MKPNFISNLLTGTLTVCALFVTVAVARREFFATDTAPTMQPKRIDHWEGLASTGHLQGAATAPIKVVEFSDFQCPYCREMHGILQQLLQSHPGQVAVVYRHYPLSIHPFARAAAAAAECAGRQGKFQEYADLLFKEQDSIGVTSWQTFAQRVGVPDTVMFHTCQSEKDVQDIIATDLAAGDRIGITGTPTIVIRNERVSVVLPLDSLEKWVRRVQASGK